MALQALSFRETRARSQSPVPTAERVVEVGCTWINIFSVSTVDQTFEADISIRLSWRETDPAMIAKIQGVEDAKQRAVGHGPSAHGKAAMDMEDFRAQCWDPQFQFPNCQNMDGSEQWVRADREGEHLKVTWAIRFKCNKFTCLFDLRQFPFDQQALFIRVSSGWDETKVQFVISTREFPCRQAYDDYNLPDYTLLDSRIADVKSADKRDSQYLCRSSSKSSNLGVRYNSIYLIQNVIRNPAFYLLNLYLPSFLISSSCLVVWVFLVEDFASRSNIIMTLLLTVVAFRPTIGQNLPRLPYITFLDRYAVVSLGMIVVIGITSSALSTAAICVEHPERKPTLCTNLPSLDHRAVDHADYVCLVVLAVCWLVYQFVEAGLIMLSLRIHPQALADMQLQVANRLKAPGPDGAARLPSP